MAAKRNSPEVEHRHRKSWLAGGVVLGLKADRNEAKADAQITCSRVSENSERVSI